MPSLLIIYAIYLTTLNPDETIRLYGAGERTWQLTELHGAPFEAPATFRFISRYKIAGRGPCNTYSARMDVPYPWFGTGPIAATKRACPDLQAETAFFSALSAASISKVENGQLLLSNDDGLSMVFEPAD